MREVIARITAGGGWQERQAEQIVLAPTLTDAVQADPLASQFYGQPPLRQALLLPSGAQPPARKYLDWHHDRIFAH